MKIIITDDLFRRIGNVTHRKKSPLQDGHTCSNQLVDDVIWTVTHQIRGRTSENFNFERLKAFERKLVCRRSLFDTPFLVEFTIADDPACVKM
jgi:hypothetical protein